jgi:thiol-disulfide isomerase/thioredoxin
MSLKVGERIPSLTGATAWINEEVATEYLIGAPVLVHFWASSCPICKVNMGRVHDLRTAYAAFGLRLVSVHLPRMPSETELHHVERVVRELSLNEPCAVDNTHAIGNRFQVDGRWPYYLLFDSEGKMRSHAVGGGGLCMVELALKRLCGITAQSGAEVVSKS